MNRKPITINGRTYESIRPRPTYVTRVEITYTNHAGRPVKVSTIEDLKTAINRDYAQSGRIPPEELIVPLKLIIHPRITPIGGYANQG